VIRGCVSLYLERDCLSTIGADICREALDGRVSGAGASHSLAGFPGWQFSATMAFAGALQSARRVVGSRTKSRMVRNGNTAPAIRIRFRMIVSPYTNPARSPPALLTVFVVCSN